MFGKSGGSSKPVREPEAVREPIVKERVSIPLSTEAPRPSTPVETRLDQVVIKGQFSLTEAGEMKIDGHLQGNINCYMLSVGHSGSMTGDIEADRVHIAGAFEGRIKTRILIVGATAKLKTPEAIVYDSLTIEADAQFEGTITRPSPGTAKAKAAEKAAEKPLEKRPEKSDDRPEDSRPAANAGSATGSGRAKSAAASKTAAAE